MLKAHVNNAIRAGGFEQNPTKFAQSFVQKYIDFMTKEIDKVKIVVNGAGASASLSAARPDSTAPRNGREPVHPSNADTKGNSSTR